MRGDSSEIQIGEGTNIQDLCVLHVDENCPLNIGRNVTVGHGVILHGCTIGDRTIVGMGATIMDGATVGSDCLIGAGALISQGVTIPDGSLVMGLPGKVIRPLTNEEKAECLDSARRYLKHAHDYVEEGIFLLGSAIEKDPYRFALK